jgi:hypothetical protein
MKHLKYLVVLCLTSNLLYAFSDKSFMTYRSQGFNFARNNLGNLKDHTTHTADVTVEYTSSFDNNAITEYFFGCNDIIFSGSRVANRGANDILADYFGLPTDFRSSICFSPKIQNIIADLDFYWLLEFCNSDFDLRVNIPITNSRWALNPCETVLQPGTSDYPAGYMSRDFMPRSELNSNALQALSGETKVGDLTFPLQFGRIACGTQSDTKIADIYIALGYNIPCTPLQSFHIDLNVTIPTGTVPNGRYLFAPQIGNGHHWAFGASVSTQYDFITDCECDYQVSIYFDAIAQHLFKSTQMRSYDLIKNGPGSRYTLLEDLIGNLTQTENFSPILFVDPVENVYITRLLYVIDATTLPSQIKINAQADISVKLAAKYKNFAVTLGYNLWVRSAEKLVCRERLQHDFFATKGDAQVYGFLPLGPGITLAIPVNATQSTATIHKPQGAGNTVDNFVNNNADNAALIYNVGAPLDQTKADSLINTGVTSLAQTHGSNQAILVTNASINNCSGLSPRALTNKIFGSIEYDFTTCEMEPYLLLGGEAEFATKVDSVKTAISQWGIWITGGVSY